MFEFNLVDRPWIPCVGPRRALVVCSLRAALVEAPKLVAIAGDTPLETAALHRLLLAILHRVYGPRDCESWHELWAAGAFPVRQLDEYLERWRDRFDLFSARRPFYQVSEKIAGPKPVSSLMLELSFGNKGTLFDHHTDGEGVRLTPAKAARALLAAQTFGLAGLSGMPAKFTDGPWARGAVFLVQGTTLFETLVLNLIRYPPPGRYVPHTPDDLPAWEMDNPFKPERSWPKGYLDYLTWQNRRVRLFPEGSPEGPMVSEMSVAPGLRLAPEIMDPAKHYRRDAKRGWLVQRFSEDRALWRDSATLLQLHHEDYQPPYSLQWLSQLIEEGGGLHQAQTLRLAALGMANKKARVDFYRDERLPLPSEYLTERRLVERLGEAIGMAEAVRGQLLRAARNLARLVLQPQTGAQGGREPAPEDISQLTERWATERDYWSQLTERWAIERDYWSQLELQPQTGAQGGRERAPEDQLTERWAIERDYWSQLELPFRHLMEALPAGEDAAMGAWRQVVSATAWRAFERVASDLEYDARNLKATVAGRGQLAAGLAKALPEE